MKHLARFPACLLLVFTFLSVASAQEQSSPQPDRWRGLALNVATADDAIALLGKPDKDKSATKKGVTARYVEFKKPSGFDKVGLQFLDGKLSTIVLIKPTEIIPADNLPTLYKLDFNVRLGMFDEAFEPRNVERNQGKTYPKTYPAVYILYSSSENVIVEATISNGGFGSALKNVTGVSDASGKFPGKVMMITLKSIALNKSAGADALK